MDDGRRFLILRTALEAEVTAFLGRDRYARGDRTRAGSRNGYAPTTVKTTAGPVELARPKLRGTDTRFASRLLGRHVTSRDPGIQEDVFFRASHASVHRVRYHRGRLVLESVNEDAFPRQAGVLTRQRSTPPSTARFPS